MKEGHSFSGYPLLAMHLQNQTEIALLSRLTCAVSLLSQFRFVRAKPHRVHGETKSVGMLASRHHIIVPWMPPRLFTISSWSVSWSVPALLGNEQ